MIVFLSANFCEMNWECYGRELFDCNLWSWAHGPARVDPCPSMCEPPGPRWVLLHHVQSFALAYVAVANVNRADGIAQLCLNSLIPDQQFKMPVVPAKRYKQTLAVFGSEFFMFRVCRDNVEVSFLLWC